MIALLLQHMLALALILASPTSPEQTRTGGSNSDAGQRTDAVPLVNSAFEVAWFGINGSVGTSAGGDFVLLGSFPPIMATDSRGGDFAVSTGLHSSHFQPQGPGIGITLASGLVVLSWPASSIGYVLEVADDLTSGSWQSVKEPIVMIGDRHTTVIRATQARRFYRLKR